MLKGWKTDSVSFSWKSVLGCSNCDRYMRNDHFPAWGRPFEFNSLLYKSVDRLEESRDTVR
jgi:hypothetical protein